MTSTPSSPPPRARNQQKAMDQRGLKTLMFWVVWATISAVVFMQLYQQADLWEFIRHDTSRVTWVIINAFALGIFVSFLHVLLLTREWYFAYRMEAKLKRGGLHAARLPMRRVSSASSRFFEALQHIDKSGGQVVLTDLSTVEFASHIRSSRFVGLLGSLLITVGLIGTVMGLTVTLTGLNGALNNVGADTETMLNSLSEALSGMGLAFYTTLLGAIMGGVLLRVFAYISDNSIEALQDLLVRSCMVYASAQLTPSVQRDFLILDEVLEGMDQRLSMLGHSLTSSKKAMAEFAGEMSAMKNATRLDETDDEVFKAIAVHRHYAKVLRYELSLQKQLAGFKQRLLSAMGFQTSHASSTKNDKDKS